MADQIWSEAFGGALEILPNIDKKEQVFTLWLDIAASETFIFESTAVQYTAAFGNGSKGMIKEMSPRLRELAPRPEEARRRYHST